MEVQTKILHTQLRLSPSRWDSASSTQPLEPAGKPWRAQGGASPTQRHSQKLLQPQHALEPLDEMLL